MISTVLSIYRGCGKKRLFRWLINPQASDGDHKTSQGWNFTVELGPKIFLCPRIQIASVPHARKISQSPTALEFYHIKWCSFDQWDFFRSRLTHIPISTQHISRAENFKNKFQQNMILIFYLIFGRFQVSYQKFKAHNFINWQFWKTVFSHL